MEKGKERKQQKNSQLDLVRQLYASGLSVLDITFATHTCPQNIYKYIKKYGLKRASVGVDK